MSQKNINKRLEFQMLLREHRLSKGITQKKLAELINKPQSFVSKYEIGEKALDLFELITICKKLNLNINEIVSRAIKIYERK